MPSVTGKDPAAHMLLIRDELPEVYERTATFLNVLDWINLKLTGRTVATVDSILTSWVTDNRKAVQHPLLACAGRRLRHRPGQAAADRRLHRGDRHPHAGAPPRTSGLPQSVQVVAGAIDNTAAAVGAGTTGDNQPHLYLGTSSWIAAHVQRKKTDVGASIASVPCAVPDRYLMTALQATAGANLTWLRDKVVEYDDPLVGAGHVSRDEGTIFDAFDRSSRPCRRARTACSTRPGSTASARRSTTRTCGPASSTSRSTPTAPTCCARSSRGSR